MPGRRAEILGVSGVLAAVLVLPALSGGGVTYAAFSDFDTRPATAGAGVWAPDPPEACNEVLGKPGATITWGTPGDDVILGGNHPQVLMGLGGNDTIHAGNSGDCLVGGDGDDHLYGDNAKDVILGGAGNDYLDGGNAKDSLDGGEGEADVCIGGNGNDQIVNCEASEAAPLALQVSSISGDDPDVSGSPSP